MTTVERIKSLLQLEPLPVEGGYFVVTYRSDEQIAGENLPDRYDGTRLFANAIYYLLTPDTFSAMHRLLTDEIYHFYLGDPVDMLQLWPDGSGRVVTLGPNLLDGMHPQLVVPKGVWQGSSLRPDGEFALLGTTMSPAYDDADYEQGPRDALIDSYPQFKNLILALTR